MSEPEARDDYIPASIRILNLEFDRCLQHVNYNIEKLSEMLTTEEEGHHFDVLNCIVPIITDVYKLVEDPPPNHTDDTFCIPTHLKSCREEDMGKLESELKNIAGNDLYGRLKYARNNMVAHINSSYQGYGATHTALLKEARYLIKRKDRLKKLVSKIESLVHNIEMSIREKKGLPLNADTFSIIFRIHVPEQ